MVTPFPPRHPGPPRPPPVAADPASGPEPLAPEHVAALLALARALSGAVEHADLAAIAAEGIRAASRASAVQISELQVGGALAVVADATAASPGAACPALALRRLSAAAREALRGGTPVWASTATARERPWDVPLDAAGAHGAAWAFLPLAADHDATGVVILAFDDLRDFDRPTRSFLTELASECANALARGSLFTRERRRAEAAEQTRDAGEVRQQESERLAGDRTHLFERERFARARAEAETVVAVRLAEEMERAQRLMAALAHSATEGDVLTALAEHGPDAFDALGLTLLRPTPNGELEIVASAGFPEGVAPAGQRLGRSGSWAEEDVFRTGRPSWHEAREVIQRFRSTWEALLPARAGSWLGVPVGDERAVRGVLAAAFSRERAFTPEDRVRLRLLAEECASVLSERIDRSDRGAQPAAPGVEQGTVAHVAEYWDEGGRDGPARRLLGVFSSDVAARRAVRALRPSVARRAWITSWTLDVPRPRGRVEVDPTWR